MTSPSLLAAKNLVVAYGENKVLDGVSFTLQAGEILMLVGANGAGKSTLLKSICGLVPLQSGAVFWRGQKAVLSPPRLVRQGLIYIPQDQRVFPEMSVAENIRLGAFSTDDREVINERFEEVLKLFPSLIPKLKFTAAYLSGGERQIVSLARALMMKPDVLLLDEPSVGLAPKIVTEVFAKIREIHQRYGTSLVIVEHNLKSLLRVADRALILAKGKILREDTPQALLKTKILEQVFFGEMA